MKECIHVMDLTEGHLAALTALHNASDQLLQLNLESERYHFVQGVILAFGRACFLII